jgi:hypothetical protein
MKNYTGHGFTKTNGETHKTIWFINLSGEGRTRRNSICSKSQSAMQIKQEQGF